MAIDKKKFLADQKWKADLLINSNKDTKVASEPYQSGPFIPFKPYDDGTDYIEDYRGQPVFGVEEGGQTFFDFPFVKIRENNNQKVAHHLGDHFQDVPPQEILRRHITGEQPLPPEDLERIFGSDYEDIINQFKQQLEQKQSLLIATHDRPLWRTPPATGAAADNLADDLLIRSARGLINPSSVKKPLG